MGTSATGVRTGDIAAETVTNDQQDRPSLCGWKTLGLRFLGSGMLTAAGVGSRHGKFFLSQVDRFNCSSFLKSCCMQKIGLAIPINSRSIIQERKDDGMRVDCQ